MRIAMQKGKKLTLKLFIASALLTSVSSHAIILGPIFDEGNLIENLGKQVADLEKRITDAALDEAKRQLKASLMQSVGLASATNAASKQSADQKLKENIRNNKVAMENTPLFTICDDEETYNNEGVTVTRGRKGSILSFSLRVDDYCTTLQNHKDEAIDEIKKISLPDGNADDEVKKVYVEKKEKILDGFIETVSAGKEVNIDYLLPQMHFGLTKDQYDEAIDKAFIMLPTLEPTSSNSTLEPKGMVEALSKSMRAMMPYQVVVGQLADKLRPDNGIYSERESQEKFAEEFYSSDNIERYTYNAMLNIDQVRRERAIMKAHKVHMAIQRYKTSLNKEVLKAIELLEQIPD